MIKIFLALKKNRLVDGFARFGVSWKRYDYFLKMSACVKETFYGKRDSKVNAPKFMKLEV